MKDTKLVKITDWNPIGVRTKRTAKEKKERRSDK
jgi:hypothetical protein